MSDVLTVKIVSAKHPQGWVLLNLSDYDAHPEMYELYVNSVQDAQEGSGNDSADAGQGNTPSESSSPNSGSPLSLPEKLDTWKKADLAEYALEQFEITLDPEELTQIMMVTAIKDAFKAKFPEAAV
jgi:hypothetical protein